MLRPPPRLSQRPGALLANTPASLQLANMPYASFPTCLFNSSLPTTCLMRVSRRHRPSMKCRHPPVRWKVFTFDSETTGVNSYMHSIIDMAACDVQAAKTWDTLVHPGSGHWDSRAQDTHGA